MEYKKISSSKIATIGVGTWGIGGKIEREQVTRQQRQQWAAAIREAIDLGMTHIDASEIYAGGLAEEIIGEAIKGLDREEIFITTKAGMEHLGREEMVKACERSLKRLGTSYADLYMPQRPSQEVPIAETMKALEELHEKGLVRHIGVSNFTKNSLLEAQGCLKNERVSAVQDEHNLLRQNTELLRMCTEQKMLLIAYRPLAKGELSQQGIPILDGIAQKYGKTPSQVALNWLTGQERVVTIPKATSREHMLENLVALGWKMTRQDRRKLSGIGKETAIGSHALITNT